MWYMPFVIVGSFVLAGIVAAITFFVLDERLKRVHDDWSSEHDCIRRQSEHVAENMKECGVRLDELTQRVRKGTESRKNAD